MTQIARISDTGSERRLQAERLVGAEALQQAQALRFSVFSGELNAKLKGAELGLDMDDYDVHCSHIGVRDLNSGRLVATTRLLDHQAASSLGAFTVKKNSACTACLPCRGRSWKSAGPVSTRPIATAAPLQCSGRTGGSPEPGPLSLPDGLRQYPDAGWRHSGARHHAAAARALPVHRAPAGRAEKPLPALDIPANVIARNAPPATKASARLGAKICGEPAGRRLPGRRRLYPAQAR